MSSINRDLIKRLAEISRIRLSEEDEVALMEDLQKILGYVDKIKEVDVGDVEDFYLEVNVVREDVVSSDDEVVDRIMEQVPDREGGFVKVKRILKK